MRSTPFINKRTGEIVTQVPLSQIADYEQIPGNAVYSAVGYSDLDLEGPSISEIFQQTRPMPLNKPVEITEAVYEHFYEILPPMPVPQGFAMIEADSDVAEGVVRSTFVEHDGRFFHFYRAYAE